MPIGRPESGSPPQHLRGAVSLSADRRNIRTTPETSGQLRSGIGSMFTRSQELKRMSRHGREYIRIASAGPVMSRREALQATAGAVALATLPLQSEPVAAANSLEALQ